jgi:hypothetical protein
MERFRTLALDFPYVFAYLGRIKPFLCMTCFDMYTHAECLVIRTIARSSVSFV